MRIRKVTEVTPVQAQVVNSLEGASTKNAPSVTAVNNALNEIKNNNATKSFNIPIEDWTQEEELYTATITDNNVAANDFVDIAIDKETYQTAQDAGIKGYVTEETGGIKLYADSIPEDVISGKYTVSKAVVSNGQN